MINTGSNPPVAADIRNVPTLARQLPLGFLAACAMAFCAAVAGTVYFCRVMSGGMDMPGDWTMSMMWMRKPGQTWFASAISFLLMWLAMMLPSALPTLVNTKRAPVSLSAMAAGYFGVWLAAGAGIYVLGIVFVAAAMRWESFSRAVPALSGVALMVAGAIQFTRWKMTGLLRCRSPFGCVTACPEREADFRLGCKQGATCCRCCAPLMTILIVLGMMNPFVIIFVAMAIAAEKLFPRPAIVARLIGISAFIAGVASLWAAFLRIRG